MKIFRCFGSREDDQCSYCPIFRGFRRNDNADDHRLDDGVIGPPHGVLHWNFPAPQYIMDPFIAPHFGPENGQMGGATGNTMRYVPPPSLIQPPPGHMVFLSSHVRHPYQHNLAAAISNGGQLPPQHRLFDMSSLPPVEIPPFPVAFTHTQMDYIHFLIPDQNSIISSSFYWGKIDRFEAEQILANKPEGTFLLRDSVQDEFVFSISFRRYTRTLHARIEQHKHKFSLDSHDPNVYQSTTINDLLEHYKYPESSLFFEPLLTIPQHRKHAFSLKELARAAVCDTVTFETITLLDIPLMLKEFLREYNYKQVVGMRRIEAPPPSCVRPLTSFRSHQSPTYSSQQPPSESSSAVAAGAAINNGVSNNFSFLSLHSQSLSRSFSQPSSAYAPAPLAGGAGNASSNATDRQNSDDSTDANRRFDHL